MCGTHRHSVAATWEVQVRSGVWGGSVPCSGPTQARPRMVCMVWCEGRECSSMGMCCAVISNRTDRVVQRPHRRLPPPHISAPRGHGDLVFEHPSTETLFVFKNNSAAPQHPSNAVPRRRFFRLRVHFATGRGGRGVAVPGFLVDRVGMAVGTGELLARAVAAMSEARDFFQERLGVVERLRVCGCSFRED